MSVTSKKMLQIFILGKSKASTVQIVKNVMQQQILQWLTNAMCVGPNRQPMIQVMLAEKVIAQSSVLVAKNQKPNAHANSHFYVLFKFDLKQVPLISVFQEVFLYNTSSYSQQPLKQNSPRLISRVFVQLNSISNCNTCAFK